ncbi:MAG: SDR family oxidoreductase [Bacteroidales bacterium]|nr:SDR family oxidoreductase [Bacteroidales bacterium]
MTESYNPFSLKGKAILITGASSGIGRATAIACSKMGATLIITGRNKQRLEETFSCLEGINNIAIPADLTNQEDLKKVIDAIPKLDGIVLAAGIVQMYPIQFVSVEKFDRIFQTNLYAPIELLRVITKKKLYNSGFSIVAIDSVAGNEYFSVGNSIYGAGKAALKSFLKYFSLEMAKKDIRVNTISPGLILTPMQTKGAISEEDLSKAIETVPMKRWGKPEEIAPAAVFLLSDMSSYMTGSDIRIDGGFTI